MATVTIFSTISRNAGTYFSPTTHYSGAGLTCDFTIVSTTWATDNPAIQVKLECQQSWDGGTTWESVMAFTTIPGSLDKNGQNPTGGFRSGDARGDRLVRGVLTLSGTLTMGVTVSIF